MNVSEHDLSNFRELYRQVNGLTPTVTVTDKKRIRIENGNGEKIIDETEFLGMLSDLEIRANQKTNIAKPFGFLTWWTIHQGIYSVNNLAKVAEELDLPKVVQSFIQGASEKSAWRKATQLGALGAEYDGPVDPGCAGKFFTKNLGGETRAITFEVIDPNNKVVSSSQVAVVGREEFSVTADVQNLGLTDEFVQSALVDLINAMQEDMDSRINNIDDAVIRRAILSWLERKRRVCVRGTGGVYFIPGTDDELRNEILSVRNWIMQAGLGLFSTVQLRNDGATSIDDFQKAAVDEILKEIQEIGETVENYDEDVNSRSINSQWRKMQELREKVQALEENLGQIASRVNAELEITFSSVRKVYEQTRDRNNLPKKDESSEKKSGTVRERNKRRKL